MLVASVGTVCVQAPIFVLTRFVDPNRLACGRVFRAAARLVVRLSPLWQFAVDGSCAYPVRGAAVVVSNHESHLDAFLISHLGWEMKWLAKRSLFAIPFIGWAMAMAGDVAVRRGNRDSARQAMGRLQHYLRAGVPVCLFPEGTRSTDDAMLPFRDGAFRLALEANVPLLPLAVAGTRSALKKHDWRFGRSRGLVRVGVPIDTNDIRLRHTSEAGLVDLTAAIDTLSRLARAQILAMRTALLTKQSVPTATAEK